jgi:hypothetical protein
MAMLGVSLSNCRMFSGSRRCSIYLTTSYGNCGAPNAHFKLCLLVARCSRFRDFNFSICRLGALDPVHHELGEQEGKRQAFVSSWEGPQSCAAGLWVKRARRGDGSAL